ncbi:hypothetical protein [Xylocopilactobacillus apicola]|uniref:Integral membrane protein n=1 Tax=Xylocopilactobacillus apicola TaxID=2932184 RepID=A0AAU9CXW5_9LACO|nr:hypothetical protein [Xylocopilactobacillus apicola]BDR58859.1 hypothetical protein XA3_13000 [Xylocopilactobacillus apicola]
MKTRVILKFILMFIIPYLCAALTFAGIFLAIIVHTHSLWRILLCAALFGFFMYFVRIAMQYPLNSLRARWRNSEKKLDQRTPLLMQIFNFLFDTLIAFLAVVAVRDLVAPKIIVNHFVGVFFTILFISLLLGNLIPPSLAVIQDNGSND